MKSLYDLVRDAKKNLDDGKTIELSRKSPDAEKMKDILVRRYNSRLSVMSDNEAYHLHMPDQYGRLSKH